MNDHFSIHCIKRELCTVLFTFKPKQETSGWSLYCITRQYLLCKNVNRNVSPVTNTKPMTLFGKFTKMQNRDRNAIYFNNILMHELIVKLQQPCKTFLTSNNNGHFFLLLSLIKIDCVFFKLNLFYNQVQFIK